MACRGLEPSTGTSAPTSAHGRGRDSSAKRRSRAAPRSAPRRGPASRAAAAGARYHRPPASSASTRPVQTRSVISSLASRRQSASAASTGWMKASCASVSATLRTVTMASVPSRRVRRSTPASAPKVVSGCCGPRMVRRLPARHHRAARGPGCCLRHRRAEICGRRRSRPWAGSRRARLPIALELSVLSFRLSAAISAISASRWRAASRAARLP